MHSFTSLNPKTMKTADQILKDHEDANEMHFHQVDREWIIEAMEEYAKTVNSWISFDDQQPERGVTVLVCDKDDYIATDRQPEAENDNFPAWQRNNKHWPWHRCFWVIPILLAATWSMVTKWAGDWGTPRPTCVLKIRINSSPKPRTNESPSISTRKRAYG